MTDFYVNIYEGFPEDRSKTGETPEQTEQGQAETVREVLTRFAKTGIPAEESARQHAAQFADEFDDDEPINSERVTDLLERPSFEGMDEMDMIDYVRENSTEVNKKDLQMHLGKSSGSTNKPSEEQSPPSEPQTTDNQ